jgi:hypothetical protein
MTTELQLGELIEAFEYLDELRESGRTNMFGAASYIHDELCWEKNEALEALKLWMETFDHEQTVEERVAKALSEAA